jgi:hypothetical protein
VLLLLQPAKGAEAHILDDLKHLLFPVTTQMPPAVRSKKNRPGWVGGTQIRATLTTKSRQGQVLKHHILWVSRPKPIIWQLLCSWRPI